MLTIHPSFGNLVCPVTTNTLDEENLAAAEMLISRWDTKTTSKMLFQSTAEEVRMYMENVENLQRLMENLSAAGTNGPDLSRAQGLMKMSMARLQNEFHKILLSNSEAIEPDRKSSALPSSRSRTENIITTSTCSDDDGDEDGGGSADCLSVDRLCQFHMVPLEGVVDLQNIAQRMAKSGYASECIRVFILARKSVVEESLYNLGVEKVTLKDVRKMEWKFLDEKIKKWIYAAKTSIRLLFAQEKRLCDDVFQGLDKMRDSCFAEIAMNQTSKLFSLAEAVAATSQTPERVFRVLDLYETLTDLMPDIKDTFSQNLCRSVHEQAEKILALLDEVAQRLFTEFDKAIEKENSKAPVAGGTVHPLTRYVMNYLTFLSDYKKTLENITADARGELPKELPDDFAVDNPSAPLSVQLGWTIFLLLCKLGKKSDLYKDVALSYLFLMNNLHYIVQKVNGSELKFIVGEGWVRKQCNKATQYSVKYEKAAWMKVYSGLTEQEAPERFKGF
ncbi:hypothetical protein SUGI_0030430 [Cryptomeria japonica]|nr:hypothetical protein SUGI_0030430 [Cryptomeria japonica]